MVVSNLASDPSRKTVSHRVSSPCSRACSRLDRWLGLAWTPGGHPAAQSPPSARKGSRRSGQIEQMRSGLR
jgi:hypothetical protein